MSQDQSSQETIDEETYELLCILDAISSNPKRLEKLKNILTSKLSVMTFGVHMTGDRIAACSLKNVEITDAGRIAMAAKAMEKNKSYVSGLLSQSLVNPPVGSIWRCLKCGNAGTIQEGNTWLFSAGKIASNGTLLKDCCSACISQERKSSDGESIHPGEYAEASAITMARIHKACEESFGKTEGES